MGSTALLMVITNYPSGMSVQNITLLIAVVVQLLEPMHLPITRVIPVSLMYFMHGITRYHEILSLYLYF